MPELPEVETIRRHLAPHVEGRTLHRLEVLGSQANQEYGQSGGQSSTGQVGQDQGSDTTTLGEGSQSEQGSQLGSQSTSQSDQNQGGFVGSQRDDSGEYLQQSGSPESGFAEQGRGASNENSDIERSQDDYSDNEGSSGGNI